MLAEPSTRIVPIPRNPPPTAKTNPDSSKSPADRPDSGQENTHVKRHQHTLEQVVRLAVSDESGRAVDPRQGGPRPTATGATTARFLEVEHSLPSDSSIPSLAGLMDTVTSGVARRL